jgi:hypothetical protein
MSARERTARVYRVAAYLVFNSLVLLVRLALYGGAEVCPG